MDESALHEELKSGGAYPTGPCSAIPQERNQRLLAAFREGLEESSAVLVSGPGKGTIATGSGAKRVGPGPKRLLGNLAKTAVQGMRHGAVSAEIREERFDTCKKCPFFMEESKRCSDCGCFMEAKTWVGGDPNMLCPQQKWSR